MAHTPTPWTFDGNCGGYIEQAGDKIARAYARDDAAFIVQAVNGYEKTMEALRRIEGLCDAPPGYHSDFIRGQIMEVAQSILAEQANAGFFANLTPEQQKAALEYRGEENHGDETFKRTPGA